MKDRKSNNRQQGDTGRQNQWQQSQELTRDDRKHKSSERTHKSQTGPHRTQQR
ncbi:hypothetical protein [Sphingomonas agri]|uniref:hypothetical protein n=1 Tax=Sphingomonas agri TaxID=1813878 RepID=UPI00311E7869